MTNTNNTRKTMTAEEFRDLMNKHLKAGKEPITIEEANEFKKTFDKALDEAIAKELKSQSPSPK